MPGGLLGRLYRSYFTAVLPRVGGLVSGDASAYAYLPASVQKFPSPEAFGALMERADLSEFDLREPSLHEIFKRVVGAAEAS